MRHRDAKESLEKVWSGLNDKQSEATAERKRKEEEKRDALDHMNDAD